MKIGRRSSSTPRTNEELLELCDYATDEDVSVQVAMEDIARLGIQSWHWDGATQTAWVTVRLLRFALVIDSI